MRHCKLGPLDVGVAALVTLAAVCVKRREGDHHAFFFFCFSSWAQKSWRWATAARGKRDKSEREREKPQAQDSSPRDFHLRRRHPVVPPCHAELLSAS